LSAAGGGRAGCEEDAGAGGAHRQPAGLLHPAGQALDDEGRLEGVPGVRRQAPGQAGTVRARWSVSRFAPAASSGRDTNHPSTPPVLHPLCHPTLSPCRGAFRSALFPAIPAGPPPARVSPRGRRRRRPPASTAAPPLPPPPPSPREESPPLSTPRPARSA